MKEHSKFQLRYTIIITMVFFIVFSTSTVLFVLACEKKLPSIYSFQPENGCNANNIGASCIKYSYKFNGNDFNAACFPCGVNCYYDCVRKGQWITTTNGLVWQNGPDLNIEVTMCSKIRNAQNQEISSTCVNNNGTFYCNFDPNLCERFFDVMHEKMAKLCSD
ncbi:MAG: hypothetical protein N3A54_06470 [Patescibacteria group bacterium]|nr:hypothetical protein [Patescibacteria group bacterium]